VSNSPYVSDFPKLLFRCQMRPDGSPLDVEECAVYSKDQENLKKAEGWFDDRDAATEVVKRARREQQESARQAAERRQIEVFKRAFTEWQQDNAKAGTPNKEPPELPGKLAGDRHPDIGNAPTVPVDADGEPRRAFFSVKEAAKVLKVKDKTIYREIKRGELLATKVGRALRIHGSELAAYQRRHSSRK
jgi:excisionase family DNA binding protein